jgi:hypothetical protein
MAAQSTAAPRILPLQLEQQIPVPGAWTYEADD